MVKFETVFTIRVLYKSGYAYEFEVTKFNIKNGTWSWENAGHENKPILLNVEEVAAVFQVGYRRRMAWVGFKFLALRNNVLNS
jgi:hypothetical protein